MHLKTIKPLLFLTFCQFILNAVTAQSVAINTDGSVADATALLDVKSSTKGVLIPRMTSAQRTGISTPATGLLVFDTDTNAFWYYNGTAWTKLVVAGDSWSITGNSGTTAGTNFIGTIDNVPLTIKVNNQPAGFISIAGTTGNYTTSLGYQALSVNSTGKRNTAFGYQTLMNNTTPNNNTAVGYQVLSNSTIGANNSAVGVSALYNNTYGSSNTAVGSISLAANTDGSFNTAIGGNALFGNTSGNNNTAIGYNADVSTGTLTNATAIGYGATVDASNKVRIGNSAVTVIEGQVTFTTPSDGRFKYNIKEDVKGLDFILQLRPVTYQFDVQRFDASMENNGSNMAHPVSNILQASYNEAAAIRRTGFIAQEVEQAAVKTDYDFSGINKPKTARDHYSLSYESFVVPLVKAVQEQNKQIEELKKTITMQQQALEELTKRLEKLEKQ